MITARSVVLLTILTGPERTPTTYPGTVLATTPTLDEKFPAGDIAYLAPQRANLIGTPDWRNALDLLYAVKHKSHDDVANAKESAWYEEVEIVSAEPTGSQVEAIDGFVSANSEAAQGDVTTEPATQQAADEPPSDASNLVEIGTGAAAGTSDDAA